MIQEESIGRDLGKPFVEAELIKAELLRIQGRCADQRKENPRAKEEQGEESSAVQHSRRFYTVILHCVSVKIPSMSTEAVPSPILRRVCSMLAALYFFGALGIAAELLLLEHTEGYWQLSPLILLAGGCIAQIAALRGWRSVVLLFALLMILTVASGAAGFWLHFEANFEFEQEIYPELSRGALLWKSLHGTSPPALAPGAMALLGCIGLIWVYAVRATDAENPVVKAAD